LIDIGPEPPYAGHANGEVRLLLLGEFLDLARRHDLLGQRLEVFGAKRRKIQSGKFTVDTHGRGATHL
jgi:hypothetical protein